VAAPQATSAQAGPSPVSPARPASAQAGPSPVSPARAGSAQAGPARATSAQAGPAQPAAAAGAADLGAAEQRPERRAAAAADDTGPATGSQSAAPRPRRPAEDGWRTAADEGWHRALAAAEPDSAGTTRSGLPKRVPQAQLVPGGIQDGGSRDQTRRTPDEVRGLLSAYHRGVQRGRIAGSAEAAAADLAPKENEQ
jgi:hypothetical protein